MRRATAIVVAGAVVIGAVILGTSGAAQARIFGMGAEMTGAKVVPPAANSYQGFADIGLNTAGPQICADAVLDNPTSDPITGIHLHQGAAGAVGGPPLIDFGTDLYSCQGIDYELMVDIVNNPENYYYDVHTQEFPDGAVRGQLHAVSSGTTSTSTATSSTVPSTSVRPVAVAPRFTG